MRIRVTETKDASEDGFTLKTYEAGQEYDMSEKLRRMFVREGWGEEVSAEQKDAGPAPEDKDEGAAPENRSAPNRRRGKARKAK